MSEIVNPRDLFLQISPSRLLPVTLPPNVIIPILQPDPSGPPTPTGFAVSAAFTNLFIQTSVPLFKMGHGYKRTNVYGYIWTGGPLPVFGNAVRITSYTGTNFSHPTNPGLKWHLWVTWETVDGVESPPAGGTNGLVATTGQDVDKLVAALTGIGQPFKVVTSEFYLPDGSLVPVGTYTADAFIHNGQITNAKIANLAVDNAKIASLAVNKLTAGAISVGQYITSFGYVSGSTGWAIDAAGNAEFSNALLRGAVYASAGEIGGTVIDGNGLRSATFAANAGGWQLRNDGYLDAYSCRLRGELNMGDFTGYAWPPNGGGGAHLSQNGLLLGNALQGQFVQITNTGSLFAPGFQLSGGNAQFSGNLSGATGEFAGTLRAGVLDLSASLGISYIYKAFGDFTVTVPAGRPSMRITVVAGGGGGGGGGTRDYSPGGGGGGSGGKSSQTWNNIVPGTQYILRIGAGGAGGLMGTGNFGTDSPGSPGQPGQSTSVDGMISAGGGGGGGGGRGGTNVGGAGGAGGSGTSFVNPGYFGTLNSGGDGGGSTGGPGGIGGFHGPGTDASGNASGGGGGSGHQPNYDQNTYGGRGTHGFAVFEFMDPNGVVLRAEFDILTDALIRQNISVQ